MGMRPFADCWWSSIRNLQTQLCCGSMGGFCLSDTLGMTPREMRLYLDSLIEWQDESRAATASDMSRQRRG